MTVTVVTRFQTQTFFDVKRTITHANMYELICENKRYLFPIKRIIRIVEENTNAEN